MNYDGTRIDRGFSSFFRVPDPNELAGHFSKTIIDPTTGQPFPNNTIPTSRNSRLAQVALQNGWFPAPNANSPLGNYSVVRTLPQKQNQFTVRIDQDLGSLGRAFVRYTDTRYENRQTTGNVLDISDQIFVQNAKNWQVSHTWPIHSNLVNSFRFGRVWADAPLKPIACPQAAIDAAANTGIFQNIPDDQRNCPNIGFPSTGLSGTGGPVNAYSASTQPMWDVSNTTTWIKGNHTFNFGANYRRWWLQRDLATDFTGNFNFGNGFTVTGSPVADFLLGYWTGASSFQPAGFSVAGHVGNPREMNFMYFAPYIQDDWKVSSKLTLNLGLRYDYRRVPYETNDHMGWRNLNYAPGGLLVADPQLQAKGVSDGKYYQQAGRRSPDNPDRFKVFAPRLGFAYRPGSDDKTVIRGGFGRFYDSAEGREIDGAADIYPYVSRGIYSQSVSQTTPFKTTNDLFPSFASQGLATPAANTFLAVSMSPQPRNPYVDQWSLGVQRQLTKNTVAELNYVGSKGNNLLMRINIAQALEYTPSNPTVAGRKPFPNFGVYIDSTWSGTSKYNGLNAKIEHHGRALLLTAAYTWSKSTDSKSAAAGIGASSFNGWQGFLDNHNPGLDYGPSDFDVDHRAVASFVWNLPFGKGERYASSASGVANAIIGGWQVNGIYIWQHGFPITIQAADVGNVFDSFGTNRANVSGDPNAGGGTIEKWFNTGAFSQPALGQFGNSTRNMLRAPTINNLDLALFKNFDVTRGARLQFRFESFKDVPAGPGLRPTHVGQRRPDQPARIEVDLVALQCPRPARGDALAGLLFPRTAPREGPQRRREDSLLVRSAEVRRTRRRPEEPRHAQAPLPRAVPVLCSRSRPGSRPGAPTLLGGRAAGARRAPVRRSRAGLREAPRAVSYDRRGARRPRADLLPATQVHGGGSRPAPGDEAEPGPAPDRHPPRPVSLRAGPLQGGVARPGQGLQADGG